VTADQGAKRRRKGQPAMLG